MTRSNISRMGIGFVRCRFRQPVNRPDAVWKEDRDQFSVRLSTTPGGFVKVCVVNRSLNYINESDAELLFASSAY